MKAIVFDQFGEPATMLQVRDLPMPQPGPGEVRVRMIATPINPSDLMVVRGIYGRLPTLPATPGFEGVGVVEAVGTGWLARLRAGKRVAVLNGKGGNWAEQVVVPAKQVVPVWPDIPDDQAASWFVNPATVLVMVRWVLKVQKGEWLLQTAAAGALGQLIVRLSKLDGFKTINVVRRQDQAKELERLGADAVICSTDESIEKRVMEITKGSGARYALDAVGGQTGADVVKALGSGGRLLVYGTLANEPMPIDPRFLMTGHRRIEGFWLSNWVKEQNVLTMLRLFRTINRYLASGLFTTRVAASFPLDEIATAARHAETAGRGGKVLLRLRPEGID